MCGCGCVGVSVRCVRCVRCVCVCQMWVYVCGCGCVGVCVRCVRCVRCGCVWVSDVWVWVSGVNVFGGVLVCGRGAPLPDDVACAIGHCVAAMTQLRRLEMCDFSLPVMKSLADRTQPLETLLV